MSYSVTQSITPITVPPQFYEILEEYRASCLWYQDPSYVPETREEWLRALTLIERYGDMDAFRKVSEARKWLSRPSKARL